MKKLTITMILLAIAALCTASYFLLTKFRTPENAYKYPAPPFVSLSPTRTPTKTQTPTQGTIIDCRKDQLLATISPQGAAGNIYAAIEITNTSKTACDVVLGNTISYQVKAKNIITHHQQTVSVEYFKLEPGAKVYSQIHYPNGPQCQSGVSPKPITFLYEVPQTEFTLELTATQKMTVQACVSESEKTSIDIWPLSKTPLTP